MEQKRRGFIGRLGALVAAPLAASKVKAEPEHVAEEITKIVHGQRTYLKVTRSPGDSATLAPAKRLVYWIDHERRIVTTVGYAYSRNNCAGWMNKWIPPGGQGWIQTSGLTEDLVYDEETWEYHAPKSYKDPAAGILVRKGIIKKGKAGW